MRLPDRTYPITLNATSIAQVLPHRGDILCVRRLTVLDFDHYIGHAVWPYDLSLLQGHFPGMPLVPGVLLIEAVAQVAGAGMLEGDATAHRFRSSHVGMLAAVRKCSFRRAVRPNEWVRIDARSRQMSLTSAVITAELQVGTEAAASVEIVLVNTPREVIAAALAQPPQGTAGPNTSTCL